MQSIHGIDLSNVITGLEKHTFQNIRSKFYYLVLADASKQPRHVKSFEIDTKTLQTEKTVELGLYTDIQTNKLILAPVQDVSKRQPLMKCILSFKANLQPNTVYRWCLCVCQGQKLNSITGIPLILAVFEDNVSISIAAIKGNVYIDYSCDNLGYFTFTVKSCDILYSILKINPFSELYYKNSVFVRFSDSCKTAIVNVDVSFSGTFEIFNEIKLDLNSIINHINDADILNDDRYQDILQKMINLETKCDKQGEKLDELKILLNQVLERQSTVLFPLLRKLLVNQLHPTTVGSNELDELDPTEEEDYNKRSKGYWQNPLYEYVPEMKQNQGDEEEKAYYEEFDIPDKENCPTPDLMPSLISGSSRQSSEGKERITYPPQYPPPRCLRPSTKIDSNSSKIPLESHQRPVSPPNSFDGDWELNSFDGK